MKKLTALLLAGIVILAGCGAETPAGGEDMPLEEIEDYEVIETYEEEDDYAPTDEDDTDEPVNESAYDYLSGVFAIGNSMLVLVRNNDEDGMESGIYDGRTGELITPGFFRFRDGHVEDINFWRDNEFAMVWTGTWEDAKYGFLAKDGTIAIPLVYDAVDDFTDGLAQVVKDGKRGFINTAGEVIIPFEYDISEWSMRYEHRFHEGLAAVGIDGKWGFINQAGEIIIPLEYDDARQFSEGMAAVQKDGYWGFVNTSGELVVDTIYAAVRKFQNGSSVVEVGDAQVTGYEWTTWKAGMINTRGEEILPAIYGSIGWFDADSGLAEINYGNKNPRTGKIGYVNTNGEIVISLEYDDSRSFENGFASVGIGNASTADIKWGLINTKGEVVIPLEYGWWFYIARDGDEVTTTFSGNDGNNYYAVFNINGEVIIPVNAVEGHVLPKEGVRAISDGNNTGESNWGLINSIGEIVIPLEYGWESFYSTYRATITEGITFLEKDGKWGFATIEGDIFAPPQYDFVGNFINGLAWVAIGENWWGGNVMCGFIDRTGEYVIPLEYSRAIYIGFEDNTHYIWAQKNDVWEVVTL